MVPILLALQNNFKIFMLRVCLKPLTTFFWMNMPELQVGEQEEEFRLAEGEQNIPSARIGQRTWAACWCCSEFALNLLDSLLLLCLPPELRRVLADHWLGALLLRPCPLSDSLLRSACRSISARFFCYLWVPSLHATAI